MSKNGCYESPCAVTGGTIRKELNTGLEEEPKGGPWTIMVRASETYGYPLGKAMQHRKS